MSENILEIHGLSKSFPGVRALDKVEFSCKRGEVHALAGENGAGKSTLLKIISGLYQPDEGTMIFDGEEVKFHSPADARAKGIGMVYQELSVLPELTVAQNVFLNEEFNAMGKDKKSPGLINDKLLEKKTAELAKKYGIEVAPHALVRELPIAKQQMVEIIKIMAQEPKLLILDEPTSSLGREEVDKLFAIVENLLKAGVTVIFISHRMEEMFRFAHSITVFKDGTYVGTVNAAEATEDDIIRMMVGRDLQDIFAGKCEEESEEIIFEADGLKVGGKENHLQIKKGQIVSLAGLQGQGQTEFLRALAGVEKKEAGVIKINGETCDYASPRSALKSGVAYIPENRKVQGLAVELTIRENIAMASLRLRQKMGLIDRKAEKEMIRDSVNTLRIKAPSYEQYAVNLSGGNQQKVVISKALAAQPKVLLINEPTRGIDVEAKQEVYRLLRKLASKGIAILMYSSDLMEVVGLSDVVLPMYEGEIRGVLTGDEITEMNIMKAAVSSAAGGGE